LAQLLLSLKQWWIQDFEKRRIRGSGGKAPTEVPGQSPWSGSGAEFLVRTQEVKGAKPHEDESFVASGCPKKEANLPLSRNFANTENQVLILIQSDHVCTDTHVTT